MTRERGNGQGALFRRNGGPLYRGRVLALTAGLALAAVLIVGCSSTPAAEWTVRQDPGGLGFWAGPAGGPEKFYPSAYSNPVVNRAGGPDR